MHDQKSVSPFPGLVALILLLVSGAAAGLADQEYLPPDDAFRPTGKAMAPDLISVRWDIAEGYYLYRNKFRFTVDDGETELGSPRFPPAEVKQDEFFGEVSSLLG